MGTFLLSTLGIGNFFFGQLGAGNCHNTSEKTTLWCSFGTFLFLVLGIGNFFLVIWVLRTDTTHPKNSTLVIGTLCSVGIFFVLGTSGVANVPSW